MAGTAIQRVEPAAAHELVVEEIRRAIHMGTYVPGDRLPAERALAEQLGVSRATLREAIGVLRAEGYLESRQARIPAGRRGDPRELAATAVFLASDAAGYITGQTLAVDGGMTIT